MGQDEELQVHNMAQDAKEADSPECINVTQSTIPGYTKYKWWFRVAIYTLFVLVGQSAAILLGRLYYNKGGKSIWIVTLMQLAGFPVLIPYYCISPAVNHTSNNFHKTCQPILVLASVYIPIGTFLAANTIMYSIGLLYLPVSTFSLLCTFQLAFNAFFNFILRLQKFTPVIINSLVLLTISSTLLVFQSDSANPSGQSLVTYKAGFICTIVASAGYGLMLSLIQLSFRKVLKRETYIVVLELIIYESLVATCVALVGFFASGDWKRVNAEMDEFELGRLSYVMTLTKAAIASQVFAVGAIGLIYEVSSLFSNIISVVGLPLIPVLAVFLFHEQMDGIKAISMALAIWGFVSYVYQCYLDNSKSRSKKENASEVTQLPLLKEVVDD